MEPPPAPTSPVTALLRGSVECDDGDDPSGFPLVLAEGGVPCHLASVDLIALSSGKDLGAYFEGLLTRFYRRDARRSQVLEPVRVLRCSLMGCEDDESFAVGKVLHRGHVLSPALAPGGREQQQVGVL